MSAVNDDSIAQSSLDSGVISRGQLEEVRQEAEESGAGLVSVLLEKGYSSPSGFGGKNNWRRVVKGHTTNEIGPNITSTPTRSAPQPGSAPSLDVSTIPRTRIAA